MPSCYKPKGCPIEDIATDLDIDNFLNKFQMAKGLFQLTEMPDAQREIFKELGLLDNPEFHLELELLFAKGLQQRRDRENVNSKKDQWRQL